MNNNNRKMRSGENSGRKMNSMKRMLVLLFAAAFFVGTPLSAYVASAEETVPEVTGESGNLGDIQPDPNANSGQPAETLPQEQQQQPQEQLPQTDPPAQDPAVQPNTNTVTTPEPQPDANVNGVQPVTTEPQSVTEQGLAPEEMMVLANSVTGTDNVTPTPTPTPTVTPEPTETKTVIINETDEEKKITVSAENIPQSSILKVEEITDTAADYADAVYNPVNTAVAAEGAKQVVFALKLDLEGTQPANDVKITIQGNRLSDLPEQMTLYQINEQKTAEKITFNYSTDYNKENKELSFSAKEFSPLVLVIPETEHVFDAGTVTEEATCAKDGVKTFKCKNPGCTEEKTETIEKIAHTPKTETVVEAATCEKEGTETAITKCSVCGEEISRETKQIPALGHKWDSGTVTLEATCTKEGVKTFKCTNAGCTATKTESIPMIAHKEITETTRVAATCEKEGTETKITKCSVCGAELNKEEDTILALGHKPGTPVEENRVEPKAGQPGSYEKVTYCTVCKKELKREKVEIPALPATEVRKDEKNITFNKAGENSMVSVTAENAPLNANLMISSVSQDVIELVEKSTISKVKYDVWFAVDINMGGTLQNSVNITLQSPKLANLPSGALLYHIDPARGKVRKTSYTYNKSQNSLTFRSKEFSPFMILVEKSKNTAASSIKDSAANNDVQGSGGGVPTYYPAGDNGTGYYGGGGGYNATGFGYGGFNETAMFGGMNNTNVTGFNDTEVAGENKTKAAGENGTNSTAVTNTTSTNTTGAKNETSVEKEESSGGGLSTGALIGIIAAIIAAAAVAFGVVRYLQNSKRKE